MKRTLIFAMIWFVLASIALFGLLYSAPALLILIVAWCGGVISRELAGQIYLNYKERQGSLV